jgi:hypothetical protein
MDSTTIRRELGVSRKAAEAIMRQLPKLEIEGFSRPYVRRVDVERYLEQRTKAA